MNDMKITMKELRAMNPLHVSSPSDKYYAQLANRIYKQMISEGFSSEENLSRPVLRELAIVAVKYFEDVVSGMGIWAAFRNLHYAYYGKKLPFYDIDEDLYSDDEVNVEDIKYLVWSTMSQNDFDTLYYPHSLAIEDLAALIFDELDMEFGEIPINSAAVGILRDASRYDDFMKLKYQLMWVLNNCYLTAKWDIEIKTEEMADYYTSCMDVSYSLAQYAAQSHYCVTEKIGPMALLPQQWLAAIMQYHGLPQAEKVNAIEGRNIGVYLVESTNDTTMTVKSVDSKYYDVEIDSFDPQMREQVTKTKAIMLQLVQYNGVWMSNGMSALFTDVEPYHETATNWQKEQQRIKLSHDIFHKKAKGKRYVFFENYNDFKLWAELPAGKVVESDLETAEHLMLCIPDNDDPTLYINYVDAIFSLDNPFYDEQYALDNAIYLLTTEGGYSYEEISYLIKNGMLQDASFITSKGRDFDTIQDNLDFYARFFQSIM